MAQLNFTQNGLAWISDEISVSSDFNLHIEREKAAQLNIMQKTSGEKWADIIEAERYANKIESTTEDDEKEVFSDIISMLHCFAMKMYSRRRKKKMELIKEDLKNELDL